MSAAFDGSCFDALDFDVDETAPVVVIFRPQTGPLFTDLSPVGSAISMSPAGISLLIDQSGSASFDSRRGLRDRLPIEDSRGGNGSVMSQSLSGVVEVTEVGDAEDISSIGRADMENYS